MVSPCSEEIQVALIRLETAGYGLNSPRQSPTHQIAVQLEFYWGCGETDLHVTRSIRHSIVVVCSRLRPVTGSFTGWRGLVTSTVLVTTVLKSGSVEYSKVTGPRNELRAQSTVES